MTVVIHPSSLPTPNLVLMSTEEVLPDTKCIAIITITNKGDLAICHSMSSSQELCYMKIGFDHYVKNQLFEDEK